MAFASDMVLTEFATLSVISSRIFPARFINWMIAARQITEICTRRRLQACILEVLVSALSSSERRDTCTDPECGITDKALRAEPIRYLLTLENDL